MLLAKAVPGWMVEDRTTAPVQSRKAAFSITWRVEYRPLSAVEPPSHGLARELWVS
jgi:hypothetical protein